jgi:hypothetical protein
MVEGFLHVPRLGRVGEIRFLVDTGSDRSLVHPVDALHLGIDLGRDFAGLTAAGGTGLGGGAAEYPEACELFLRHADGTWDDLALSIGFAEPSPVNTLFPSLLGRDVLRFYRFTFEELGGLVRLEYPPSYGA